MELGVVLLAAGASSRMGKPKMLLPWGATSVIGHSLDQWQSLRAEQIAVVYAADDCAIQPELDRLGFSMSARIANSAPEGGMFSSIQCAARWSGWKANLSHWAVVLGDQPHLRQATLQSLLDFAALHPDQICQPSRGGRHRHPVFLPKAAFHKLKISTADNLKSFLLSLAGDLTQCELDDPGLDLDIDRPEDYALARRLYLP